MCVCMGALGGLEGSGSAAWKRRSKAVERDAKDMILVDFF